MEAVSSPRPDPSYAATAAAAAAPLVYCVHGNKWGIADLACDCDNLAASSDSVHCHTERTEGVDVK